jgi:hypothetical protein
MVNKILLSSSLMSVIVHIVLFSIVSEFPQPWIYCLCLTTSVWNHGLTSTLAKWTDRVLVVVCVSHNIIWFYTCSHHPWSWWGAFLTLNGVSFYLVSKMFECPKKRTYLHMVSHVCATLSNICLGIIY